MQPYTAPALNVEAFNCPHCNAFAKQNWHNSATGSGNAVQGFRIAICTHCYNPSYWFNSTMIYPNKLTAPLPNGDLPDDIKVDFEEARQISNLSPKGAAALLRLVIQKLCIHLGEPGKDLNKDIGNLVKSGLSPKIQKALDVVRVIGNGAVHPGQIDLNDNPAITSKLFELVNFIADKMITENKEIDGLYNDLPDSKKEAIEKRDQQ